MEALDGLIKTLQPEALTLREELLKLIPPRAAGRGRTRESFNSRTSVTFDGISLAETAANLTSRVLFHPARATRLVEYHARDSKQPGLEKVLKKIINGSIIRSAPKGLAGEVKRNVDFVVLDHLMNLAISKEASPAVNSIAMQSVSLLNEQLKRSRGRTSRDKAHLNMIHKKINIFLDEPSTFDPIKIPSPPPGSPIGSDFGCTFENISISIPN